MNDLDTAQGEELTALALNVFGIMRGAVTDSQLRACLPKYPGDCPCGVKASGCDYHRDAR